MDIESEGEEEYSSFSAEVPMSINDLENKINLNNDIKKKKITNEQWNKELNSKKINKDQMNQIIANYLFVQGYTIPLKKFIKESKIKFEFDEKLLNKRFLIRQLITENKIEDAITEINLINEKILSENKNLLFILQRQVLLNHIKENNLQEALDFAKNVLLPLTKDNDFLFKELEKVMCLLAYENVEDAPEKELFTKKFLEKISSKTNLVILNYMAKDKPVNLKLELLIKLMMYVQTQLKKEIDFPQILEICPLKFSSVK